MWWALWAGIAAMAAIILFSGIENDIPDDVRQLLRLKKPDSELVTTSKAQPTSSVGYFQRSPSKWSVRSDGSSFEVSREATSPLSDSAGRLIDSPYLTIHCFQGALYVYLQPQLPIRRKDDGTVAISYSLGKGSEHRGVWRTGKELALFADNPRSVLAQFTAASLAEFALPYAEGPTQRIRFTLTGLTDALRDMPKSCLAA